MNGVIGMADILNETKLSDEQRDMLATVRTSARSLLSIINDILDFSKIEAGRMELAPVETSICSVVEGVAETLFEVAKEKDVELHVYVDPVIPAQIICDKFRIRQVLLNIVGNAIKFSGTQADKLGEVCIRVTPAGESADGALLIDYEVADNGIGMSPADRKKLFKPFSQVDGEATTRRFGGTGLGLSISKRLVDLMDGDITVESTAGEGSTFKVTVPHGTVETAAPSNDSDLSGVKVLVLSGRKEVRTTLDKYATHWLADVETADTPEALIALAEQSVKRGQRIDVVVFGVDVPEPARLAVMEKLNRHDGLSDTNFVLLRSGRRHTVRQLGERTVETDAYPLLRAVYVTAIAVAAGRASPEIKVTEATKSFKGVIAPTVEMAEKTGQLILVAEDDPTNRRVIGQQLRLLGYAAEFAKDGKEAFLRLPSKPYAVLLTDCHMPEMDGYQLTTAIRAAEKDTGLHIPIIALTANALQGERQKCLALGMDDFLTKPTELHDLKATLKKWMPSARESASEAVMAPSPGRENAGATPEGIGQMPPNTPDEPYPSAETADGKVLDQSALARLIGDDPALILTFLKEFVSPAARDLSRIETAFAARSASDIAAVAHRLKSSSRSIGAETLADLCTELEPAGNTEAWATIEICVARLPATFTALESRIEAL